jgi:uncharacterized protein with HEPN domain
MSKMRRDFDFLLDIQDAIDHILEFTSGLTMEDYLHDRKTQDAVVHNLEVMGEATKNLSDELRTDHPTIPWRDISGTRDRLVHHYFGINQDIVWQIITQDLPAVKGQIKQLIQEFQS